MKPKSKLPRTEPLSSALRPVQRRRMTRTQTGVLALGAGVALFLGGCAVVPPGPGYAAPYDDFYPNGGPYDGPYFGPYGPYGGGEFLLGGIRHPGHFGGHHFAGSSFGGGGLPGGPRGGGPRGPGGGSPGGGPRGGGPGPGGHGGPGGRGGPPGR